MDPHPCAKRVGDGFRNCYLHTARQRQRKSMPCGFGDTDVIHAISLLGEHSFRNGTNYKKTALRVPKVP